MKITNRTNKKASEFASELGYSSVDFSSFKEELKKVDIAIFSTSSKNPLLSKNEVEKIMSERDNELLMIDLSVPRNIPDSCNKIENVKLINVDGLKDVVNVNYKKRKAEVKKAEKFIDDFLSEFDDWTNSRQLRPSILSIKNQIKDVVVEETINNINSSSCDCNSNIVNSDEFNAKLNKIYEKFSDNLVRKIKEASNNGKDEKAIEIINQIFLDD